jgi:hypothetical protein
MRFAAVMLCLLGTTLAPSLAQSPQPDPWVPVRGFVGKWEGTATGQAGDGKVEREYRFVLGGRFIHERNVSTYPPQEKNKKGEVHEHWSFLSYDRARKALVLRQFHVEGFVNQYAMSAEKSSPTLLVFESDGFENFSNKWRARETYEIVGPDEMVETFELAPPDKPFEIYSRNRLKRTAR